MAITSSRSARPQTNYVATTGGTASYASASLLPFSGNKVGDEAFVVDANKLYIWDGAGWFNVALINETPSITTGANVAYNVSMYSPETVTLAATDPEGVPITWGYTVSSGVLGNSTVGINGNTYTITAGTGAGDSNNVFSLTFTASDGINTAVDGPSEFTILFGQPPGEVNGWFGGGGTPANVSTVDRIDYAADTTTALIKGPLSSAMRFHAATGNANYGWFAGGYITTLNRIDYSADLNTALARGTISTQTMQYTAMTGNDNYGWVSGGPDSNNASTTINRIDFADDLVDALIRGPFSVEKKQESASSNSDYSWFAGGYGSYPSPFTSSVQRIIHATDTLTSAIRGRLSAARYSLTACGNSNYGWHSGGNTGVPGKLSIIDRINYASDTGTASVRGPLTSVTQLQGATGNNDYGWVGAGHPTVSKVDRITYADDTAMALVRGPLSLARYGVAAAGGYPG